MPKTVVTLMPWAILLTVFALIYISAWRQARHDRYKIMSSGRSSSGVVTRISAPSKSGRCYIHFTFQLEVPAKTRSGLQPTTRAAIDYAGLNVGSTVQVNFLPKRPQRAFIDSVTWAERIISLRGSSGDHRRVPSTFYISYSAPVKNLYGTLTATNGFRWYGSGDITITDQAVLFTANRRRPFWFPKTVERTFPLSSICDVERLDNTIRLVIVEDSRKMLQFWTIDGAQAERLVQLLPSTKTKSFSPVMAERAAFNASLLQVTPKAPVTPSLIAINALMFVIATVLGGGFFVANPDVMIRLGTDYTPLTLGGQWWRLLTSIFLHFGFLHLAFNMWALYFNGLLAERIFGSARYLLIYLVAGLSGSLASLLWHPVVNSAGASGAIFGVLGALLAFFIKKEVGVPASVIKAQVTGASVFVVYSLLNAARYQGIDNAAHIGGLAGGFIMGLLLSRPLVADRETKDWTPQWLVVLGVVSGVAILIANLLASGRLAPRIARDVNGNPIPLEALTLPVRSLGGVHHGMNARELLQSKGDPIQRRQREWLYNTVDSRHDGVLSIELSPAGNDQDSKIVSIEFIGNQESAPVDLPFLRGLDRSEIIRKYGEPIRQSGDPSQRTFLLFRNGIFVALDDTNRVRYYGIFDLTALR